MEEMAANLLKITRVSVAPAENTESKYDITVMWRMVAASQTDFLWLVLLDDDKTISSKKVSGKARREMISFESPKPDTQYYVMVSDEETSANTVSDMVEVFFKSYTGVRGSFNGTDLQLSWDAPDEDITYGQCVIRSDNNDEAPYASQVFARYERCIERRLLTGNYDPNAALQATVTPYRTSMSSGPDVLSGWFFLKTPEINLVSVKEEDGGALTIRATYTHGYSGDAWSGVEAQAFLMLESNVLAKSTVAPATGTLEWKLGKDALSVSLEDCRLHLYLLNSNCISYIQGASNIISLRRPSVESVVVSENGTTVTWTYDSSHNTKFHIAGPDGKSIVTSGYSCFFENVADRDFAYSVKADNGLPSVAKCAFANGYYPGERGWRLHKGKYSETKIEFGMADAFKEPLSEPLAVGAFSLSVKGIFSIDTKTEITQDDFDEWMMVLLDKQIKVSAFYEMRQCIARTAGCDAETLLYIYAGLSPQSRSVMIAPGFTVKVEVAAYNVPNVQTAAGHVKGSVSRYPVSLSKSGILSVNPFAERLVGGWLPFETDAAERVSISGELDFLAATLQHPYACLWYPPHFQKCDEPSSPYYSDNIVLLSAASPDVLKESVVQLNQNPTKPLTAASAVWKGRASVWLEHIIWLNGQPLTVPVGLSLHELCQTYLGQAATERTNVTRQSFEDMYPVHEASEELILLSGDHVNWA